jgi:iron complex transport system substrate-binding protein
MQHSRRFWYLPLIVAAGLVLTGCATTVSVASTDTPIPPAATVAATITPVPATATTAAATATLVPATETAAPATATLGLITLTDDLGRPVTLTAPALHVVSLAPSNTEILFALGAGATLVGRDDYSDYPAEAAQVPSIGNLYPHVNAEAIVALHPDLVLAAGVTSPEDVAALAKLGLTVYATGSAVSLDDIYRDIQGLGTLVGKADAAKVLVDAMRARAEAVKTKAAAASTHPVVFYELDATDPAKPWTAGPGSFVDQLITLAGGTNAGNIAKDQYAQLSLEQLVSQNPDLIVLGSANFGGQTPELVAARPGWQDIKAVKNHAVYTFDDNLVSRPGPRVVDGLEKLAALIHPEIFK